jgi:hypothetical protein
MFVILNTLNLHPFQGTRVTADKESGHGLVSFCLVVKGFGKGDTWSISFRGVCIMNQPALAMKKHLGLK